MLLRFPVSFWTRSPSRRISRQARSTCRLQAEPGAGPLHHGAPWHPAPHPHIPRPQPRATFTPPKLPTPPDLTFWSLEYNESTRLILLVCRPGPLATHLVLELTSTVLETVARVVTTNQIMRLDINQRFNVNKS